MPTKEPPWLSEQVQRSAFLRERVAIWFSTAAAYSAAAYAYERLSGLSDAELQRRGLSRGDTGRAACAACDRTREPAGAGS
jgi:hypothetical protein